MKYIIFDLDGTLIDSMPTWYGTGAAFLEKHGFAVPGGYHDVVKITDALPDGGIFQA